MPTLPRGLRVEAPQQLAPVRFGLLSVVEPITPTDIHFEMSGVEWEEFLCSSAEVFLDDCPPASGFTKSANRDQEFCHADPFIVNASYDCSTGGRSPLDAWRHARRRLLAWENFELERTLWTGVAANGTVNPSFAFGNDTCGITVTDLTPGGGPVDVVAGIATLEEALTDIVPGGGAIHVPYGLNPYLSRFNLLIREGDRYFTPTGNSYVIGAGYPGSGPANAPAAAGTTWLFATGPVGVWRSEAFFTPPEGENALRDAVNRSINDVTVRSERVYAAGFSCALLAINVTLCPVCP